MKRFVAVVCLVLLLAVLLAGCVRFDATVKINANGTADLRMLIAVSESIASAGGVSSFGITDEDLKGYAKNGVKCEEYKDIDAGYTGYMLSKNVTLSEIAGDNDNGLDDVINGRFIRVNGNHVLVDYAPFASGEYSDSQSYISSIKSFGGYMRFNLELPVKPTKHNADSVSADGKTLTWDLTTFGKLDTVYVEFDFPSTLNLWLILAFVGLGMVVVVSVVVLIVNHKHNKALADV